MLTIILLCFLLLPDFPVAMEPYAEQGTIEMATELTQPVWYEWLIAEKGESLALRQELQAASDATGIEPDWLLAVLMKESNIEHWDRLGQVKRGDGGAAIGIAQIHRSPWEQHYTDELKRPVNLDIRADNIFVCAKILERGGWFTPCGVCKEHGYTVDDAYCQTPCEPCQASGLITTEASILEALSYYNTGKRGRVTSYARSVAGIHDEIISYEEAP